MSKSRLSLSQVVKFRENSNSVYPSWIAAETRNQSCIGSTVGRERRSAYRSCIHTQIHGSEIHVHA